MTSIPVWITICLSAQVIGQPKMLIVDQDGGADDAIAIFEAFIFEKYFNGPQVLAMTTTHGNVNESQAFANTQRFLHIADRQDVPIYRGGNSLIFDVPSDKFFGKDGLGNTNITLAEPIPAQSQHAACALIELTKKYPGQVNVVAMGALTNIALAIRLDPNFLSRVATLYMAVGYREEDEPPNTTFNVLHDVEAYHIVMQAAIPGKVTIIYFSNQFNVTTEWRKNVLGSLPTAKIRTINEFERVSLNSAEHAKLWYLLDPLVMAVALNNQIVQNIQYAKISVVLWGAQRGVLNNNFTSKEKANVRVFQEYVPELYKSFLYKTFAAEV